MVEFYMAFMKEGILQFHSWDEVTVAIKEIRDRCKKLEAETEDFEGAIHVKRLKELTMIKKRINQLDREFDVLNEAVRFLKTIPKAGKEAEVVGKKFSDMYKSFKKLKKHIEKEFFSEA
jgi:hypothetical protein